MSMMLSGDPCQRTRSYAFTDVLGLQQVFVRLGLHRMEQQAA